MKPISLALALLGLGAISAKIKKDQARVAAVAEENERKEERQKNMPYAFDEGFTEEEFRAAVYKAKKRLKRISNVEWRTDNPLRVHFDVRSHSGITDWWFRLDFNDEGHFNEDCHWYRSNTDSEMYAKARDIICEELRHTKNNTETRSTSYQERSQDRAPIQTDPEPEYNSQPEAKSSGCLGCLGSIILIIIALRILSFIFELFF